MASFTAASGAGDRPAHPSPPGAGAEPSSTDTPFSGWAGLTPQPENIPEALKALEQWVCWRAEFKYGPDGNLDRVEKIPVNPFTGHNASSTDPATWAAYEVALAAYEEGGCDGLGFVLTPSDPYFALDFDHVGDARTGQLGEAVSRAIGALGTYAEWSPSGTGIRIFGRGAIPPGRKSGAILQFWDRARFLTVTGHKINGAELGDFNAETLTKVIDHFNPPKPSRPDAPRQGDVFDIAGAIRDVLAGDSLHDSLRDLAASMAAAGIAPHVARGILRGVMDHSMAQAKTPGRWEERAREIDGLVESAMKFAKAGDGPPREWPDIEPLGAGFTEPLPFPVGSLPNLMQKAVVAFHAYGQQPMALIVCSSLSAMSVACQGLADVARDAWLVGPMSVFCLPMGESGERKTAVDNAFSKALREWERDQQDAAVEEIKRAKGRHRGWEAKMKGLERALGELTAGKMPQQFMRNKAPVTSADIEDRLKLVERQIEDLAREEPVIPTRPRLLYSDTTIEGLLQSMERGLPIGSLWEDEAGVTFGSVGLSNERLLSFLTGVNKLWDGKSPSQIRASVESRDARGKRVCANLMIQPFLLSKLAALMGGTARSTGFLSRFLICEPQSTMGVREYRAPSNLEQVNDFNRRVRELLDMPLPMVEGSQYELDPPELKLSPQAFTQWRDYLLEVERELAPEGDLRDVRDFASKSAEQAARIAGIFHVFEKLPGTISAETMAQAIAVARWFLVETLRVFQLRDIPEEIADAMELSRWMAEKGKNSYTASDVATGARPRHLREDKPRRDRTLTCLCQHGYLVLCQEGKRRTYYLNPSAPGVVA